jgi:hypothetical protein
MPDRYSKTNNLHDRLANKRPGTLKEVLSDNVKAQQRRKEATASPPEARRSPSERIKSRETKGKTH